MAKVIVLCGKIASGKTTYGKKLEAEENAVTLSFDDLMLELYDGCLGDKHDETAARITRYFYKLADQLLEKGHTVLFDYGHWTRRERESVLGYFQEKGIPAELHFLNPPEEIRLARLKDRNDRLRGAAHRVYLIEGDLLARLDGKFEAPSAAEYDKMICT